MSIESLMPSNHLILCHPLLLLPSVFPSIRVFSNELALHIRWLKYWNFSFSISLSNEYSGLISSRIDWLDLLAVQGTLKNFLQHNSVQFSSVQFSRSVMSDSLQRCGPQHARLPAFHHLPELAQTHVHWVSDAIKPSYPLSPPSPPALNLSQHQGLFWWVHSGSQSIGASASASVLPMNIQDWFPLGLTGWISLQSKGLRVFSSTTVQKFKSISYLALSLLYVPTLTSVHDYW